MLLQRNSSKFKENLNLHLHLLVWKKKKKICLNWNFLRTLKKEKQLLVGAKISQARDCDKRLCSFEAKQQQD